MKTFSVRILHTAILVGIITNAFDLALGWTPQSTSTLTSQGLDCDFLAEYKPTKVQAQANTKNRRSFLSTFVSAPVVLATASVASHPAQPALAAAAAVDKPQEFVNVGTQAPAPDGEAPFVTLPSGVKTKDFKLGTGDALVTPTSSRVSIQGSGRLLNLNGVIFFNTKNNNPDGFGPIPLTIDLGKGQVIPGLEEGLVGMKKGGIRRIIVPQNLAYNNNPGLEPKPMNANDQRALDSVVKNSRRDGSVLFDVQVERFK